jgi:hypothetical protein
MIHSFLLIGQSNAAGRGFLNEAEPLDTCGGRLKVMRNGLWLTMYRPVNPDRQFSGVSLAESFAKEYALAHEDVEVGIIPCADGGTSISKWMPGEILFDNAVNCVKLAMRKTELKGILWHQGEADCYSGKYELYADRFKVMIDALRSELGCPDVPVIIGALGDYLANFGDKGISQNYTKINAILENLSKECPNCAYVSAEGLSGNPDNLHFSSAALKEFGERYYKAYERFDAVQTAAAAAEENTERSSLELL